MKLEHVDDSHLSAKLTEKWFQNEIKNALKKLIN